MVQSGKDGSDGTSYERVFIHTTTESKPATPSTSQTDDYVPSGWHDDPVGVSSSLPYEWISEREKKNGIWSEFSAPALWAKYGFDGADGAEGVAGTSIIGKVIFPPLLPILRTGGHTRIPLIRNHMYIRMDSGIR